MTPGGETVRHTITLDLRDATDAQLRRALSEAQTSALLCEQQGSTLHTWTERSKAIQNEIDRRRGQIRTGGTE